ncbi:hypothetical protein P3T40_005941 [Paraburkholderia sp. EB58]|jgi:hypothetical protein
MVGNFTALALALVIMALVASIAVSIFAFEIFTLMRERVIRAAANTGGRYRPIPVIVGSDRISSIQDRLYESDIIGDQSGSNQRRRA